MARKPARVDGEKGTTHVRLLADLAEMISWIVRLERLEQKGGSALLLDPMLRPQIRARYGKYKAQIDQIKAAEAELRKVEDQAAAAALKKQPPRDAE